MVYTVNIQAFAKLDLKDALNWYGEHSKQISAKFKAAFFERIESLQDNPFQFSEVLGGIRKAVVKGYPYSVVYYVKESDVYVIAVFHHKRSPQIWKRRS